GFDGAPGGTDASAWTRWVLYLAVFAFLAAFFSFAGSAALSPATRVAILVGASGLASIAGALLHRRRRSEGMALLVLGGLLLPVAFWFLVEHYALFRPPTPLAWWCALAVVLAAAYIAS